MEIIKAKGPVLKETMPMGMKEDKSLKGVLQNKSKEEQMDTNKLKRLPGNQKN